MTRIKIIKDGMIYPKGKIITVPKDEDDESIKEGIGVSIDEYGNEVIKEKKLTEDERKLQAEWIVAKSVLGEIITNDYSRENYNKWVEKGFLNGKDGNCRISWKTWKRYFKDKVNEVKSDEQNNNESFGNDVKDFLVWSKTYNRYFVNVDKVADYLIDLFNCKTIYGKRSEVANTFNGKIWKADGREKLKTTAETLLETYARTKDINEIFEKVKRKTSVDREEFEKTDINKIPLSNGVWNVKEKKLEEHSSDNNFRFIIDIEKNDAAKCTNFLKFLNETCYLEDIPVIQEWFGFNLFRRYFIKKILILLGDKNTGKSVLLNVLTSFIGEMNKTGISLQKLSSGSDFTKLSLKDKHSNIFDDLPATDLNNSGNFKMAVGDGWIAGEEKFGDYMQFRNFAKHTMAANKIPPVKDNDDMAYFERVMIVRFDNTPEKMDLFLIDKLTTKEEMSGILNWALEGLYRLLDKGVFGYNKTAEETKIIMEVSGNPLLQFSEEVLIENKEGKITKEQMFEIYSLWANEKDKQKLAKNQLTIQLQKVVKYLINKREKVRYWSNVSLKPEWAMKILPKIDKKGVKSNQQNLNLEVGASLNKEQLDDLDGLSNIKGKNEYISSIDMVSKNASKSSNKTDTRYTPEELEKMMEQMK